MWSRCKMFGFLALGFPLFAACSPVSPVAPTPKEPFPPPVTSSVPAESPFLVAPDASTCQPGSLKPAVKQALLERINTLRALHGLGAVVYDDSKDAAAQSAALMMSANPDKGLSHNPAPYWSCFSSAGQLGAQNSGLSRGSVTGDAAASSSPSDMVGRFLTELSSVSGASDLANIGHRRWLLNPFLKKVALGWVETRGANEYRYSGSLWWTDMADFDQPASLAPEFVAYPYGSYPADAFDPGVRLSFSVLADRSSLWNNDASRVDFSNARVEMSGGAGVQGLTSAVYNPANPQDSTEGLPNVLVWRASGLARGASYAVKVSGVRVNQGGVWVPKTYQYTFQGQ